MRANQQLEQAFIALKSSSDYTFVQEGTSQSSLLVNPCANLWEMWV